MRILKDKKGLALENAILFMMIIFSLCFLLASFALIGHYQAKIENIKITQRVELDQIGEEFIDFPEAPQFSSVIGKYQYTIYDNADGDGKVLRVYHINSELKKENVLLYVEVNTAGKVLAWRYSE